MSLAMHQPRMTRDEFFAWVDTQDDQLLWEFDGFTPVAMTRPAINHSRAIRNILSALGARLPAGCEALSEVGLATIGEAVRFPDVSVSCVRTPGAARVADGVVVVFEVLSPRSGKTDRVDKLREYHAVPSILHYVIVERTAVAATLFSRDTPEAPWTATPVRAGETLELSAIGVALPVDDIFANLDLAAD